MIEKMIPSFKWDNEYWALYNLDNFKDSLLRLKYCDESVKNLIFNVNKCEKIEIILDELFKIYPWVKQIVLFENKEKLIGVFKRNNELNYEY